MKSAANHQYGSFNPIPFCKEWKIIASYKSGKVQTQIANENDITQVSVWRVLKKYNVKIRKPISKIPLDVQMLSIELYQNGFSLNEVGKKVGLSFGGVRDILIKNSIPLRLKGSSKGEKNPAWRGGVSKDRNYWNASCLRRHNARYKKDEIYTLKINLRGRMNSFFRRSKFQKMDKTSELLGCDYSTIKLYIENQFREGMTWKNHGPVWEMDHKIPLASAKTQEELVKLFHYKNLQPLFCLENRSKGKKIMRGM